MPVGTTKPAIPFSARAQITATSAIGALRIQVFTPSSTQSSPSRRARVDIPVGSEP